MKRALLFAILISFLLPSCKDSSPVLKSKDINALLPGVWRVEMLNGSPVLTDEVVVLDFSADGSVEYCFTSSQHSQHGWLCNEKVRYSVKHTNLRMDLNLHEGFLENDYNVVSITPYRMVLESVHSEIMLKKVLNDYGESIIGLWSGVDVVGDNYSDADHFWSYLPGGNYGFFQKTERGVWYKSHDLSCDYRVCGDVLFTHWINPDGEDFVENWIVDGIIGGYMKWIGIRKDGVQNEFILNRMVSDPKEGIISLITVGEWLLEELTLDGVPVSVDDIVKAFGFSSADSRTFGSKMVFNSDMTVDVTYSDGDETLLYSVRDNMIYTETMNGLPLVMNFNPILDTIVGAIDFDDRFIQIVYRRSRN